MLGMLTSIAHVIESECSIQIHQNELHLIHRFLDVIDSDEQVVICNQCSKYKWMGNQKQIELQNGNKEKHTLNFHGKLQCYSMIEALEKTNGNVSLAAKLFAVPRSTFYKRMQKFRL
ncbi:hypothetical protein II1_02170 [Bacillus cereus MC118]|uniref:DNA binding HTH domain-containing protein n=1 Tax=Bacillus cereus MC67 TaxID=1053219 RepID=J8EV97_BACCE|nr:hypothetical protein II3_04793 [Bacillus cereus MC67]EOP16213.1 hypothetical protein II1_02170 [Bacillus cereus MC118]